MTFLLLNLLQGGVCMYVQQDLQYIYFLFASNCNITRNKQKQQSTIAKLTAPPVSTIFDKQFKSV